MIALIIVIAACVIAVAVAVYVFFGKKKKSFPENFMNFEVEQIKTINGTLNFSDVVGWLKQQHPNPEKDIPFVADAKKMGIQCKGKGLFIGIYNESNDELTVHLLIEADEWDDKTKEVLGDEKMVVLH